MEQKSSKKAKKACWSPAEDELLNEIIKIHDQNVKWYFSDVSSSLFIFFEYPYMKYVFSNIFLINFL